MRIRGQILIRDLCHFSDGTTCGVVWLLVSAWERGEHLLKLAGIMESLSVNIKLFCSTNAHTQFINTIHFEFAALIAAFKKNTVDHGFVWFPEIVKEDGEVSYAAEYGWRHSDYPKGYEIVKPQIATA